MKTKYFVFKLKIKMIQDFKWIVISLLILGFIIMVFLFFGMHSTSKTQTYDITKGKYEEGKNYTLSISFYGPRSYKYTTKQNSDGNFFMVDGSTMHIHFINPLQNVFTNSNKSVETHLQIINNGDVFASTMMCSPVGSIKPNHIMCK